jgi:hypothetical protein
MGNEEGFDGLEKFGKTRFLDNSKMIFRKIAARSA